MNHSILEFECVGISNKAKFPIEYTGRGQDISHPIENFTVYSLDSFDTFLLLLIFF